MIANVHRQNGCIAADGNVIADSGGFPFRLIAAGRTASGKQIVDEHDAVTDEAMITDIYQFADETMALNFCVIADVYMFLHLHERTDEAIRSESASVQVYWTDDFNAGTENDIFLDLTFKQFVFRHDQWVMSIASE